MLQWVAVYCGVLQGVVVCYSALRYIKRRVVQYVWIGEGKHSETDIQIHKTLCSYVKTCKHPINTHIHTLIHTLTHTPVFRKGGGPEESAYSMSS